MVGLEKPNSATLSVLAAGATDQLQLLYLTPPALGSYGDQRPARPIEAGEDYPIYRFIRESYRENGAGDPCCGDCCRCSICPSQAPAGAGGRQTRIDYRDQIGRAH